MPELNEIKAEFEHRNDILFLAPTFDDQSTVNSFLSGHRFDFTPISNAQNHIDVMGIQRYPTHVIVDKNASVVLIRSSETRNIMQKIRETVRTLAQI